MIEIVGLGVTVNKVGGGYRCGGVTTTTGIEYTSIISSN